MPGKVFAQAAPGTDVLVMKPLAAGRPGEIIQRVLIKGVRGTTITVQNASGEVGYDLGRVDRITKAAPVELAMAQQEIDAGNLPSAADRLKNINDQFKGLPVGWAQEALVMYGSINLSLGKLSEAEVAFADLERLYGASNSALAKIGRARVAAARKLYTEARGLAAEVTRFALTKKNPSRQESQMYGQAYYVLGVVAEADNKLPEAMENYCRTVAIFYHDSTVVREAQKRIDELRAKKVMIP